MMIDRERFLLYHGRSNEEVQACRTYVKIWWQEELAARLEIADQVCENKFIFNLPWDMEQTAEIVAFGEALDWTYMPGKDVEFVYQMNRHRYWICLGQAYAVTGMERYVKMFVTQMADWICENAITAESMQKTWRTIEAGIRAENWIKAMGYMVKSPHITDEVLEAFSESMLLHAQYLAGSKKSFSTKSNWGILESSGLFAIGKMLEECATDQASRQRGREYARLALERLENQLAAQVMNDGVHWEQSPMYHNEVLRCCLEVLRLADIYRMEVPSKILALTKAMAYADRLWQKPDGTQLAEGDSDSTDIRDILTASALQFKDPVLKSGAYPRLDYESMWDYGQAAAFAYEALGSEMPDELLTWQRESGNWYLRSDWGSTADYFHIRCGSLGGGHGHFDKLHIDLVVNGEDFLIDPGRYTYVDGEERRRLKSAAAHNTVLVDDREYTHCLDAWAVSGLHSAINGNCKKKGIYTYIQCGHTGYMQQGVLVNRRILAIGTKVYIVCDEFYGTGTHSYSQHFHMAPECRVSVREGQDNTVYIRGNKFDAKMCCLSEHVKMKPEAFLISRHYNQMEKAESVAFCRIPEAGEPQSSDSFAKTASMITIIFCADQDNEPQPMEAYTAERIPVVSSTQGRCLEQSEAEGILLTCRKEQYFIVIAHVEAGADCDYIGAMNHYGLGRVMVAKLLPEEVNQRHMPGEEQGMTVLCW